MAGAHQYGSVQAKWVIVATNAYTINVWPQIRAELVLLPYFNLATKPLGDSAEDDPARAAGRLGYEGNPQLLPPRSAGSARVRERRRAPWPGPSSTRMGPPRAQKLFPQLAEVEFEYEWYGSIGMTGNSLPRFIRLARNVVSFSGYNGRGIGPGTAFGRTLARYVLGEIAEADLPLLLSDPEPVPYRAVKGATTRSAPRSPMLVPPVSDLVASVGCFQLFTRKSEERRRKPSVTTLMRPRASLCRVLNRMSHPGTGQK